MNAELEATHFEKESKEEAINFCIENYGGYDSIKGNDLKYYGLKRIIH